MKCVKNCVNKIDKYLSGRSDVVDFDIVLKEKKVTCVHNTDPESIMEGIRGLGKTAVMISNTKLGGN